MQPAVLTFYETPVTLVHTKHRVTVQHTAMGVSYVINTISCKIQMPVSSAYELATGEICLHVTDSYITNALHPVANEFSLLTVQ
jgi:hypothetical protein